MSFKFILLVLVQHKIYCSWIWLYRIQHGLFRGMYVLYNTCILLVLVQQKIYCSWIWLYRNQHGLFRGMYVFHVHTPSWFWYSISFTAIGYAHIGTNMVYFVVCTVCPLFA
jgi:hypothetical protein